MKRIILAILICAVGIGAYGQGTTTIGATRTTDTTLIKSQLKLTAFSSADTNYVLAVDAGGKVIRRLKGGGATASTDSLQDIVNRGRNSTKAIRFGSGANTVNTIVDSSTILVGLSTGNYAQVNQTYFRALTSGASSYDYKSDGIMKTDRTSLRTTTLSLPSSASGNKSIDFQDKNGTVALLSDFTDTIANRVLVKSDTNTLLVTHADLNTHSLSSVNLSGNTVGATMVYGVIDSYNRVERNYNTFDTFYANGRATHNAKWSEAALILYNNNNTTGVRQTNSITLGIGTGTIASSNTAFIGFGSPSVSNSKRFSTDGITGYSVFDFYSSTTAGTIIKPAFQGSNTGECISIALGGYTAGNATPNTGIMSMLRIGTGYQSTGRWTPSTGSATLNMILGAMNVVATGTYTGNINFITDDSVTLTSLGSGGTYFGVRLAKNSGWGIYQSGSSAKNAFVGRTLVGTTTDNTVDALQVVGDLNLTTAGNKIKIATGTNASIGTTTLSGGTVTVSTTAVTASSKIFLQSKGDHHVKVSATVAGTSFTITSASGSDASDVEYWIIN